MPVVLNSSDSTWETMENLTPLAPPRHPPPLPPLLSPPFEPAAPLGPGQRVFCFSLGQGRDLSPGGSNRGLAAFIVGRLGVRDAASVEVLAQSEVALALAEFGVSVAFSAEPQRGEYATTRRVLEQFVEQSPPPPADSRPVAIVAHPHHAWRCLALATMAGYAASVPDPHVPGAGLEWECFGCDEQGYDPESVQIHTQSFEAFYAYESRHQHVALCNHPRLYARLRAPSSAMAAEAAEAVAVVA